MHRKLPKRFLVYARLYLELALGDHASGQSLFTEGFHTDSCLKVSCRFLSPLVRTNPESQATTLHGAFCVPMDPQSSPGRLTCRTLLCGPQIQMLEQHLGLERPGGKRMGREQKESEGKAFIQLWNKQKSKHSAVASPWVKQRLHDCILKKLHHAASTHRNLPTPFRVLTPVPDLAFHQHQQYSSVSQTHSSKQLRKTGPIQQLKPKRSMNRKDLLRRKSSTGKQPSYDTYDSSSRSCNAPVSQRSSPSRLSDSGSQFCHTGPSHESKRNMISLSWENLCLSSPQANYISPEQEFGAGAPTLLSFNILNNPMVLPMPVFAMTPHLHDRVHMCLNRAQSLQTCLDKVASQQRSIQHLQQRVNQRCGHKQLPRTRSSPLFKQLDVTRQTSVITKTNHTGLMYSSQSFKNECNCTESSSPPEHAGRIQSVWSRIQECGLGKQCQLVPGRHATLEEIKLVQTRSVIQPYGKKVLSQPVWKGERMAAGSVAELALRVAQGELRNGFAVVKTHSCDASKSSNTKPMSLPFAAKLLQFRLNVRKILIVNWDVHHDNITQEEFYTDPRVLYISLHRYGCGTPNSKTGAPNEVGSGQGEGYNVNVAWSGQLARPLGDAEYLSAFRTVVMPIAREFCPDVVLVSSEFTAIEGHPTSLGGHSVSAKCFGTLTQQLMEVSGGHVVLALEGDRKLQTIADACEACISALLDKEVASQSEDAVMDRPCAEAVQSLEEVLHIQSKYWCSVRAVVNTLVPRTCSASLSVADPTTTSYQDQDESCLFWCCHDQNQPVEHDENKTIT